MRRKRFQSSDVFFSHVSDRRRYGGRRSGLDAATSTSSSSSSAVIAFSADESNGGGVNRYLFLPLRHAFARHLAHMSVGDILQFRRRRRRRHRDRRQYHVADGAFARLILHAPVVGGRPDGRLLLLLLLLSDLL